MFERVLNTLLRSQDAFNASEKGSSNVSKIIGKHFMKCFAFFIKAARL